MTGESYQILRAKESGYLQLARESSGRFRIIDASLPLEKVQDALLKVCGELLACWSVRQGGNG